jgi:farnesyl-diphosphate farnesyltransferase
MDTLLKTTARTLYLSAKILPRKIRKTFYCGYLICRVADTVADTEIIDPKKRRQLIKNYPAMVEKRDAKLLAAFKEAIPKDAPLHGTEKQMLDNIDLCLKEFDKLSPAHKKDVLEVTGAVCRAMEWDISYFPSEDSGLLKAVPDEAAVIEYCDSMGGQPGVFWAKLLLDGIQDDGFTANAAAIGRALQITNILRDLAQDIKIARCYLPLADLTANNLMPQDLLEKKNYKKLLPVIFKWINWGAENISAAPAFLAKIPRRSFFTRAAVAWPVLWSLDTLYLLAKTNNLLDKKAVVKISKKTIYLTIFLSPMFCCSNFILRLAVNYKVTKIKKATGDL